MRRVTRILFILLVLQIPVTCPNFGGRRLDPWEMTQNTTAAPVAAAGLSIIQQTGGAL